MDLHDFADVPMNYDCYLPEVENPESLKGFEEFHLDLAKEYGGGGVLDIACGTGALTVPLAKAGYDVVAFDLSTPMVDVTRSKLSKEGLRAGLFAANMTDFQAHRKFSLAIIARSGFMHLLNAGEQRQALLNIRSHLVDGGVLTLNHFQPHPLIQARQMQSTPDEYYFRAEYVSCEGKRERILEANTYDYLAQTMRGSWKIETLDGEGNAVSTRTRPLAMRHTYRQEMEYLFELCGFEIIDVYNNYMCEAAKTNFIWVVRKA